MKKQDFVAGVDYYIDEKGAVGFHQNNSFFGGAPVAITGAVIVRTVPKTPQEGT
jgi:hypothetical protein